MLTAELEVHLDGEAEQAKGGHRYGSGAKTVLTDFEQLFQAWIRKGSRFKTRQQQRQM